MEAWVEPGQDEIRALEVTTQAVERIDSSQVEALIRQLCKFREDSFDPKEWSR